MELKNILDKLEESTKVRVFDDDDYIQDGFRYCSKCNTRKQCEIENPFTGLKEKKPCLCECAAQKLEEENKRIEATERRIRADRIRRESFSESGYEKYTFDADDGTDKQTTKRMKNYANNFPEFRKNGQGLLLYGNVGTGKTFFSACIANQLIDDGYKVLMTSFSRLIAKIQKSTFEKVDTISELTEYDLLIIDDLGVERRTEYTQENVFEIVDARYRMGKPMIISTNLSLQEMNNAQNVMSERIYGRILERCLPIQFEGSDKRNKAGRFDVMKSILNS